MARNKNSCEKCQHCSGGSILDSLLMLEVCSRAWQETGQYRAACVFCLLLVYLGDIESLVIRPETHCGLFLWTSSTSCSTSGLFVLSNDFSMPLHRPHLSFSSLCTIVRSPLSSPVLILFPTSGVCCTLSDIQLHSTSSGGGNTAHTYDIFYISYIL